MAAAKPSMFIGSSVEGKHIAETIQVALEYEVHSTVWHQGVFGLSEGSLESLVKASSDYDFAALVLTADDLVEKRHVSGRSPRDNVLFELGLFMGVLGRERTFIVHSRTTPPMLPTDLAGITPVTFEERDNLDAALGPTCTKIKRVIQRQGARSAPSGATTTVPNVTTLSQLVSDQHAMVTELFKRLITSPSPTTVGYGTLDFLQGAWSSAPDGTHVYCEVINGQPRGVYCYSGNSEATGEYYDIRRIGDELLGRFRWFDEDLRGFWWLKIEGAERLSGAWWLEELVPEHARDNLDLLKKTSGMNSFVWTKEPQSRFPAWATRALKLRTT